MNSAVDILRSLGRLHLWDLGGTSMPSFSERLDGRPRSAGGPPILVRSSSNLPAACCLLSAAFCLLPAAGKCIGVVAILCDSFALYARISFPGLASFELCRLHRPHVLYLRATVQANGDMTICNYCSHLDESEEGISFCATVPSCGPRVHPWLAKGVRGMHPFLVFSNICTSSVCWPMTSLTAAAAAAETPCACLKQLRVCIGARAPRPNRAVRRSVVFDEEDATG